MFCVKVMYPKKPGSSYKFNLDHYFKTHMTMGLGLFRKHIGHSPLRVECDVNPESMTPGEPRYYLICSMYFNTRDEAEGFARLFAIPEAAAQLRADWPNYTELDPEAVVSEVVENIDPVTGKRG